MKKMNKLPLNAQQGFTLIELVVVIVILGILAATAAPKFIDLTGDAKASTLQAVRASVESATSMVHAKALISGNTSGEDLDINGGTDNVGTVAGWPDNTTDTWAELLDIDVTSDQRAFDVRTSGGTIIYWYPVDSSLNNVSKVVASNCYVSYTESTDSNVKPSIEIVPNC